jgi:hypothetical protein
MRTLTRLILLLFIATLAATHGDAEQVNNWNVNYADVASVTQDNFSNEIKIINSISSDHVYKVQPKRKVKVRFRARYIEFTVLSYPEENAAKPFYRQVAGLFQESRFSLSFTASFLLRGPPTDC